ncbi:MAG: hypothetical protein JSW51_06710 [Gemmatimonadota bacterium]|nr:MAG: hypothetical protein JSW51_06710 [Gemmatimonadota bacterium]
MNNRIPWTIAVSAFVVASSACGDGVPAALENRDPTVAIVADPYTLKTGDTAVTVVTLEADVEDLDGDSLTVLWTVPGGTFVNGTSATDEIARVSFDGSSARTVTLDVDDGNGGTASRAFTLHLGTGLTRFQKNYIEALFLGAGEFAAIPDTACPSLNERWSGFPRGTVVRVIVSNTVDGNSLDGGDTQQMIQDALADVPYATAGWLSTTFETTDDPNPLPGDDEATSTDHPYPPSTGCPNERGCTHIGWRDPGTWTIFRWARAVQIESTQPSDAFVHDIVGHGIMGLCHIDQESIGGNHMTLMPGGPGAYSGQEADKLTEADMIATRAVFGSGLELGAGRSEFLAADLINP